MLPDMDGMSTGLLWGFWGVFREMAPYLLFGFFVAGILSVFIPPKLVERHLGGRGLWPVAKASLFGVPLPLCSCGVIPVAASLRRHGASRAATTAFLISTPQTGVDSIMVTYSLLGGLFAVVRPIAAFLSGFVGGVAVAFFGPEERENGLPLRCEGACCSGELRERKGIFFALLRALQYGFVTLPRDIAKALLVGVAIAAVISAVVPDDFFAGLLGGGMLTYLVMMLVGIPIYVCATASVPVAAALIAKGVAPGAALVFLMTGPATNAATIATIWKTMGRRTAVIYLATVALTALASGLLLDHLFRVVGAAGPLSPAWMLPGYVKTAAAVALLIVLGAAILRRQPAPAAPPASGTELALHVKGMTCEHCAQSVRRALEGCAGVRSARVDLKRGIAHVACEGCDRAELSRAVESAGYTVADKET